MRKKKDLELVSKLKRQEAKDRELAQKPAETQPIKNTISFDLWWVDVSKRLRLPAYLKEIVWADFKARGLTPDATIAQYNDALTLFGYRV